MIYGSIPAGGLGERLQPLGFSKELAPVAGRAVIEYLIERMVSAGIGKIFVTTAEDKTDLIRYLASKSKYKDNLVFLVRERRGLLDGVVQPAQYLRVQDEIYFGLPDTIWYPHDGFSHLVRKKGKLVLGLFDTGTPHLFDSVAFSKTGVIKGIEVKVPNPRSKWTWGIGKIKVSEISELTTHALKQSGTPLFGVAMNDYCAVRRGYAIPFVNSKYIDIGVKEDYRRAEQFVEENGK